MRKIRYGLFETNSSSVHTLVIDTSGKQCGCHYAVLVEAGWSNESFDPISYLWTAIVQKASYLDSQKDQTDYLNSWKKILNSIGVNDDDLEKPSYKVKIDENSKENKLIDCCGEPYFYIDHLEGLENLLDIFKKDTNLLDCFINGRKSIVQCGNDNEDFYDDYIDGIDIDSLNYGMNNFPDKKLSIYVKGN